MKIQSKILWLLISVMLSVTACASSKKDAKMMSYKEARENLRFDNADTKKQVFDINGDAQVDMWKFYRYHKTADTEGIGELMIIRKELDVNFDGRVDRIMYYNAKEELTREEIDSNFDNHIDRIYHYDSGLLIKTEFYRKLCNAMLIDEPMPGGTRYPDLIRYYRKGIMTREEIDEKCTGHSTNVTIFNAEGTVTQTGEDLNGDGIIDIWTRY